jgi:cyclic beta-1,2-glucan synthetase
MAAPTREALLDLADKHHDAMAFERATILAWTQAQMQLHHLGISSDEAHLFQRLANHVLYSDPALRPAPDILRRGARMSSTLWAQGISGDLPIVLVQLAEVDDLELVRQLLRAHEYWRLKQLAVDLVILNERAPSYAQDLQNSVDTLVRMNRSMPRVAGEDARGAVFVLRADLVSNEVRGLLQTAARAVLRGGSGSLAEQVNRAPLQASDRAAGLARERKCRGGFTAATADTRILQRVRRLRRAGTRICDNPRRGGLHTGTLDQRHRQSVVWFSGFRRRRGFHLGAQRSAEPGHALVERPRR